MALTTTTLSSACAQLDTFIAVTSATGFAAGNLVLVDIELMQVSKNYVSGTTIPVQRGLDGSAQVAHKVSANASTFLASDQPGPSAQEVTQFPIAGKARRILSYSATGAITLPVQGEDMLAILNGTGALAMTLANPTKDMDGCMLYIVANGKAAHTVTYSAGVGNGGGTMDIGTYNATEATGCALIAVNGFWILWANGIGSSGTQVAGVVWA
jgi:hypothetical protein